MKRNIFGMMAERIDHELENCDHSNKYLFMVDDHKIKIICSFCNKESEILFKNLKFKDKKLQRYI